MSRKSRYVSDEPIRKSIARWRAAAYIRLSREDADAKDKDSQSVTTQKRIIDRFLLENPDIEIYDYYIDDGYSGTTMERPNFQRMKNDFESGTVNCIIVKDLSRFARNDDESGRYIYVIFPFYKIRFVSINDRVDSFINPDSVNNLEIPFKNIMHSEYSRDLSKKVRSASNIRRQRGEFIGAFCTYGYKKDPDDFHHLIIDEEVAENVRYIFRRYIEIENSLQIAKELSRNNVLTPLAYKQSKGFNIKVPNKQINPEVWRSETIRRILTNETYLGHLIQGTRQTISYKNHKIVPKNKEQWIKVENTHEPIITQKEFEAVQEIMAKKYKHQPRVEAYKLFAGKIFCGSCGAAMALTRSSYGEHTEYYHCNIAYIKKDVCTPKRTQADKIQKVVLDTLNYHLNLCLDATKLIKKANAALSKRTVRHNAVIEKHQLELTKLDNSKNELYVQFKDGHLTREEYFEKKKETEAKIHALEQKIYNISIEVPKILDLSDYPIFSEYTKYRKFTKLTRDIVIAFVKKIVVFSPTEIEVYLSFADEFEKIRNFILTNSSLLNRKEPKVV